MGVSLRVVSGPRADEEYFFARHDTFVVGRSSQVNFSVPDDGFMSRNHFLIEVNPPVCYLKDLGTTNGTKVNGERVDGKALHDGDRISAGGSTFAIRVEANSSIDGAAIRCRSCSAAAPEDTAVAAGPDDGAIDWFCDACIARRCRFPSPPEGFRIDRRIGGGGMGEVFLAWRLADGQPFALKVMIPTVAAGRDAKLRFRREQRVMKDLLHPNIVAFYDLTENDGQFQLIMEYVEGQDANDWARSLAEPPSTAVGARIGVQLLSAIEHAHTKGYVHRDIKPSNLLISGSPRRAKVKLSDFGLAKSFRDNAGFVGLTHQGDVGGSIGFLSPDHIRSFREVKEPADIYSAGVTLYYLMTGQFPYLNFDRRRADAYTMILEHPTVPLRAHRPEVPEAFDRIIRKAMAKQPSDRWPTAGEMAEHLRPFLEVSSPG